MKRHFGLHNLYRNISDPESEPYLKNISRIYVCNCQSM